MLSRRLFSFCNKTFTKSLSTVPLSEAESKNFTETNSETQGTSPESHHDYFNVHNMFTIKDLFDARVHYGHKITSMHHRMKPYIFGSRLGHLIFDLDVTAEHLRKALNFAAHIAYRDGIILFVSKNPSTTLLVEDTAQSCQEFALTRQWFDGLFTDSKNTFNSTVRLPDLCIFLNTLEENASEHPGIVESAKMCIPSIGIVDSNCNPALITYPVPGNDDSMPSVQLYCRLFKEAILRGKRERKKNLLGKNLEEEEKEQKSEET